MKQLHLYTLPLVLLTVLVGCRRHDPEDNRVLDNDVIRMEAIGNDTATKAFLNQGDLEVNGMKVKVYDFLSGYNGTIWGHQNGEEFCYFNDSVVYDDTQTWKWPFVSASHNWTRTGVHKFFGWLEEDPANSSLKSSTFFSTYSFNEGGQYLDLAKDLTISSPQYDFLYSEVNEVEAQNRTSSIVPLDMKHLFGAFAFTVKNESSSAITIHSITVPDFPVRGNVRIDYSGGAVSIPAKIKANDPVAVSGTPFFTNAFNNTVLPQKVENVASTEYNIFTAQPVNGNNYDYRLVWPVTLESIAPLTTFPENLRVDENEGREYYATDSLIILNYSIGGHPATTRVKFPRMTNIEGDPMAFSAGKKTKLMLQFLDKQIKLQFQVLPWDYEEIPMSFEMDAVNATALKFVDGTYSDAGKVFEQGDSGPQTQQIAVLNGKTIEGAFNIYTPVGAHIQIGVSGDTDYFTVTPSATTVNPEHVGGKIILKIIPNTSKTRTRDVKIKLHFSVIRNGREMDADTEINRDNYTIIMYK